MNQTSWQAAARYLDSAVRFGAEPGLHRIEALLQLLGRPERSIPRIVHIGGTNGKGSVAAYLASILKEAGCRVARFTSPHLIHYRERIVIDGKPIEPRELSSLLLDDVRPAADRVAAELGEYPTFFELLTATMYCWGRRQRVEWLVQEVGLGGQFDATNVVAQPDLAVITNVELDHTSLLGHHLGEIANDKAHIIKPGSLALTAATGEALAVIRKRAAEVGAALFVMDPKEGKDGSYASKLLDSTLDGNRFLLTDRQGRRHSYVTKSIGPYQAENAALAAAAADLLAEYCGHTFGHCLRAAIGPGLARTYWPGRMDLWDGSPPILVDGAHNLAGMRALRMAVERIFPGRPVVLLVALSGDRHPRQVFTPWLNWGSRIFAWAAVPTGKRGAIYGSDADGEARREACKLASDLQAEGAERVRAFGQIADGLAWARRKAMEAGDRPSHQALVIVCGSLYLAGGVLSLLNSKFDHSSNGRWGKSSALSALPRSMTSPWSNSPRSSNSSTNASKRDC